MDGGKNIRVWRVRSNSPGGIMLTPDKVTLVGNRDNFITVSPQGIGLTSKKISIQTSPENISKGVLFNEMNGFTQMIPSTVVTCIPNVGINIPGSGIIGPLTEGIGLCMMMA